MRHDTHNHTRYSVDSMMEISDLIATGETFGLMISVTEHLDPNETRADGGYTDFDQEGFFKEYEPLRQQGKVLLGIELGLDVESRFIEIGRRVIDRYPFDQVIGSAHTMGGHPIAYKANVEGLSKSEYYPIYLGYVVDLLKANPYIDTFAHIDYPSRYTKYENNPVFYQEFPSEFDAVLKTLIELDIALEINQRRLAIPEFYAALNSVVARYQQLGGRYVTIAGDNHIVDTIGHDFEKAWEMAVGNKLTPVYFKDRVRIIDSEEEPAK